MLNFILILILCVNCIRGYHRGLVLQVASILRTVLSIIIAYQFADDLVPLLEKSIPLTQSDVPLSLVYKGFAFLILLLGSRYAIAFLFGFINQIFKLPILSLMNRFGGFLFGALASILICIIIVNLLYLFPWDEGRQLVANSSYAQTILKTFPSIKKEL